MTETWIHPSPEQIAALAAMDHEGPLVMLNLLRFAPDGGREQYGRYAAAVTPFLATAGASLTCRGDVVATVIGGDEWDEMILVEYPSVAAFLEMAGAPDYPGELRATALIDSRLYCTVRTD